MLWDVECGWNIRPTTSQNLSLHPYVGERTHFSHFRASDIWPQEKPDGRPEGLVTKIKASSYILVIWYRPGYREVRNRNSFRAEYNFKTDKCLLVSCCRGSRHKSSSAPSEANPDIPNPTAGPQGTGTETLRTYRRAWQLMSTVQLLILELAS